MEYNLAESSWGQEEIETLHKVIDGGRFTMGENVKNCINLFSHII